MCQSQWCPSERIDYGLCNTTLKPLKTKMHAMLLSLSLFFLQSNQDLLMFFFILYTRLSFNVCSGYLFGPGIYFCPAESHNNKPIVWFNFTVESLWRFESKFLNRLHSFSVQYNLQIYTAVKENLLLFMFRLSHEIIRMQFSSRPLK